MKSPLLYLLEVLFCSGLLLAFYRLLLVRKISYAACRRYLVAAVLLSAAIPALDIPLYPARTVVYPLPLIVAEPDPGVAETAGVETTAPDLSTPAPFDWGQLLRVTASGGYAVAVLMSLGLFAVRIAGIRRLRRRSQLTDCREYVLAENPEVATPFSFLRTVFLGEGYEGRRRAIVLCHEASHVRHRHSAERIAVELVRAVLWFNPFFWIAARWLQEVHEWEADRDVLEAGYDLTEYRTVIFRQLFGYNPDIACGLNHSLTKKRFAMMTQFNVRRSAVLRLGAAIPVVAGMMMLCSFTVKSADTPVSSDRHVVTVHIDSDGKITLNDRPVTVEELTELVAAEREKFSEAERAKMEVVLKADKSTRMNEVTDAKKSLRRANALKVRFSLASSESELLRMLPPDPLCLPADSPVKVIEPGEDDSFAIKPRNCFRVYVDADGKIRAGATERVEPADLASLKAAAREFVLNAGDDTRLPEKIVRKFDLPDGGVMSYPVSEGIVSLHVSGETAYGRYLEVQRTIEEAFDAVRDEISRRQFGRGYASLTEPERQVVVRAVPLKIMERQSAAR